jgi:hypothetical protein
MALASSNVFPKVIIGGLTGAVTQTRLVGGNASGAPTTGTFVAGDIAADLTGKLWMCTTGGTPGTWTQLGASGSAMTNIAEQIVTGSVAASITFSSIPGTYRHLFLTLVARGDTGSNVEALMQLNADTGANYVYSATSATDTSVTDSVASGSGTSFDLRYCVGTSDLASSATCFQLTFYDYARTSWHKSYSGHGSHIYGLTAPADQRFQLLEGQWQNTAAITSIKLFLSSGNWAINTVATLWGQI